MKTTTKQNATNWKDRANKLLENWQGLLGEMEMRAKLLKMDAQQEANEQLSNLRRRWQMTKAQLDGFTDDAEDRWQKLTDDMNEQIETVRTRFNWVRQDNSPRQTDSDGWAEGLGEQSRDSQGWVEGMGHQADDSAGWSEGMGQKPQDSHGWAEVDRTATN